MRESGHEAEQAVWLALALSVLGCTLLLLPEPFLALARAEPAVAEKVRGYLRGLAFALPASLMFMAYRGFNVAVSRPKAVMVLQLGGLALKVPRQRLLVFGFALPTPFGTLALPALGARAAASRPRSSCGASCWRRSRCCGATRSTRRFGLRPRPRPAEPRRAWRRCCASACRWACRS